MNIIKRFFGKNADNQKSEMTPSLPEKKAETQVVTSEALNEEIFVFISYGNDIFTEYVSKICDDLEMRNFKIWFDKKRIKTGDNPHQKILEAMKVLRSKPKQGRFLLFITSYSVRTENGQECGYALHELQKASNYHVSIFPVVLEYTEFPMDVTRKKYLDLSDCIPFDQHLPEYNKRLDSLVNALNGEEMDVYWKYNDWEYLERFLNPTEISFDREILERSENFCGRKWIINPVIKWITDSSDSRVLLLTGEMGIGKSALATCIVKLLDETKAYHFIDFKFPNKSNPELLILNLSYQLCRKIEEYKRIVIKLPLDELVNIKEKTTSLLSLFDILILQPLSRSEIINKYRIVIIIDALDEIRRSENNFITDDFISALAQTLNKFPESVKLILTTRPEKEILNKFQNIKKIDLNRNSEENINDIKEYIKKHLENHIKEQGTLETISRLIVQKSEGMFLYIYLIVKEILNKVVNELNVEELIENLPKDIDDIYKVTFKRNFPDNAFYNETIRKYLELIFAAKDSIDLGNAGLLLNWNESQKELFKKNTGWLFLNYNGIYNPFHNSLFEWLTNKEQSGDYFIDVEAGHGFLARAGMDVLKKSTSLQDGSVNIYSQLLNELPYHLIRLQKNQELEEAICDISFLVRMFNKDKYQCIAYFNHLENHDKIFERVKANVQNIESEITDVYVMANIYQSIGLLYFETKEYSKSIFFLENAVRFGEEIEDVLIKAKIYNDLAESFMNNSIKNDPIDEAGFIQAKGNYIKAIICLWKYNNKELRNHPDLAEYINNYGHLYYHKKVYEKCEALYLKAFRIRERFCTYPYDKLLGESKFNLGVTRFYLGKEKDDKPIQENGIRLIEESLELHKKANRYWDKDVALYKYMLALVYIQTGKIDEAIKLVEESFSIRLALYGADHSDTESSFSFWEKIMSKIFFIPGRYIFQDENLIDNAVELRKERLPRYSREIVTIYFYKAAILLYKGKVDEALRSMKQAEILSTVIKLKDIEILKVLLTNVKALLRTRNYSHAKKYLERIYKEYGENLGVMHEQTLEYFKNLMQLYFDELPLNERRNAIDFILVLANIADEVMKHLNQSSGAHFDIKVIRAMSVAFNEIALNKYLPERDWTHSIIYFNRALDFMKICNEAAEIANMEINIQLAYFLSGKTVDIKTIEHAKEVLIHNKDSRIIKASLILKCLFEDTSKLKYNTELMLNLFFAVAVSDSGVDNLEVDMMKRMIDPVKVDAFHSEVLTLQEAYAGNINSLTKLLVDRSVELTKNNNYEMDEIKDIIHHVIYIAIADFRLLQSEINLLYEYGKHFGLFNDDINFLISEFL